VTILLRCPPTKEQLLDSSPTICKPYFQLRSVIAPHLEPYYDEYAAPYVDTVRPYYNSFDRTVISPSIALGKKYGAPRVQQAQAYTQAQWEKSVQPQVSKYQGILKLKYDETLGPHILTAITATAPYYDIAKASTLQTYYEHILPTYITVQPYVLQGYDIAGEFAVNTAVPYTKWAWITGMAFLDRTVRIGERLGRYRDGKKLIAIIDEAQR